MSWFARNDKVKIYICKCRMCGVTSTSEVAVAECECCGSDNIKITTKDILVPCKPWYCRLWRFIKKKIFRVSRKL